MENLENRVELLTTLLAFTLLCVVLLLSALAVLLLGKGIMVWGIISVVLAIMANTFAISLILED